MGTVTVKTAALDTELLARLQAVVQGVARKINITKLAAASGAIRNLEVDRIVLGDATIEQLILQNTSATLHSGKAYLSNVRTVLELRFTLDWWVDVWVYSDSGTENLGSMYFNVNVGDIQVPSLQNINMAIPTITVNGVHATIPPITNLDLGGAALSNITVLNTVAPSDGFQVNGLGVGSMTLSEVDIPKTSTSQATVDQFVPNSQLLLPTASVNNLQAPSTAAGNIQSGNILMDAVTDKRGIPLNFGIFGLTIWVQPVAHMNIQAMVLQNVGLSATVGQGIIKNVRVPLDVQGVKINGIDLGGVQVAGVSM